MKDYSEQLKKIRQELNLSQKDFAKQLKVTQSFYSAMEIGKKNILASKAFDILISDVSVRPEWFFTGKGEIFYSSNGNSLDVNNTVNADSLDGEWIKIYAKELVQQMTKDPLWEVAIKIQNELVVSNNRSFLTFKKTLNEYFTANRKLLQFIHQYVDLVSGKLELKIFQKLKNKQQEDEIRTFFLKQFSNIKALEKLYREQTKSLLKFINEIEPFDLEKVMKEDYLKYIASQAFDKAAPLKQMHKIPNNLPL